MFRPARVWLAGLCLAVASAAAAAEDPYHLLAVELTRQAADKLSKKTLAVLPFEDVTDGRSPEGRLAAHGLTEWLVYGGVFQVVEREFAEKAAAELTLQNGGTVDSRSAAALGKALGVEAIVVGLVERTMVGGKVVHARIIRPDTYEVIAAASQRLLPAERFADRPLLPGFEDDWTEDLEWSFDISPALRTDDFRWNIGGYLGSPYRSPAGYVNILSELTWRDLKIQQIRLAGRVRRVHAFSVLAEWAEGRIISGKNQDSDYTFDNRTAEFSRSNNSADHGRTRELRLGGGFPLRAPGRSVVTPLLGWGYASQRLEMTNGVQTVNFNWLSMTQGPLGAFGGLNSRYEHTWTGPWLGLDAELPVFRGVRMEGSLRWYTHLDYAAEANWNLRPDFAHPKSFAHDADGEGWDAGLSVLFPLDKDLDLGLGAAWRRWKASDGTDRVFFADGSVEETPFNEAVWNSFSLQLTVRFRPASLEQKEPPEPL